MKHATRGIGLAVGMLAILTCGESARASLELHFTGRVDSFSESFTTHDASGQVVVTPGTTTIGPGSTFEGTVLWAYDPAARSPFRGVFFPPPVITFTVDEKYSFTSEMPGFGGLHGAYGVFANDVGIPGAEEAFFDGGHATLITGLSAQLDTITASTLLLTNPHGEADWLIGQDLTHFVSGTFLFGFNDFGSPVHIAPGRVGHALELDGTVTSLTVVSPEPSTLISAGIAVSVGLGLAWRRRKAKLAS